MKKYLSYGILALAVLSLAACNKEIEPVPAPKAEGTTTIIATRDDAATRTVVQPNGKSIWWSVDDEIDVFYGGGSDGYVFTSLNTEPAATAQFVGALELPETLEKKLYAIYPSAPSNDVRANGEISVILDDLQTAEAGTFANGIFPAVAVSSSTKMSFKNIAGGIKFSVDRDGVNSVVIEALGGEAIAGAAILTEIDGVISLKTVESPKSSVTVVAPDWEAFEVGKEYYAALLPATLESGISLTMNREGKDPVVKSSKKAQTIKAGVIGKVGELETPLSIKTLWMVQSTSSAWNTYYGGTGGTDRNIAMDDEYVYIAESSATAKLWAISITDHKDVKAVNVEGVSGGGAHLLTCPRVIPNNDPEVNDGKDVLVCCSLTRGGVNPLLYMWDNGIDNAPRKITLTTWATDNWYGDTFTFFGTLQNGIFFFDKTDSASNGVVTFPIKGIPGNNNLNLVSRLAFKDAMGSHNGVCAYYPFPDDINSGIYSPGRGTEARGRSVVVSGDVYASGARTVALTNLDYAEGRNGFVLGYNFLEWEGKRYVIYGKQPSSTEGYVYVLEGDAKDSWLDIANKASVKFRRDLLRASGSTLSSGNSGMDVTARIIDGDLYFAAQKQNIACGVYKLTY